MLARDSGFTLPELLLASGLGLTFVAGTSTLVAHLMVTQQQLSDAFLLELELERVSHILTEDISQSGFSAAALTQFTQRGGYVNPFAQALHIGQKPAEMTHSCILFAQDFNANGTIDTAPHQEQLGFRLHDKALERRVAGADCGKGGWQDVTNPSMFAIDTLAFTLTSQLQTSVLTISLTMSLASQAAISRQTELTVVLRYE